MVRRWAAIGFVAVMLTPTTAVASADPATPCGPALAGAMTWQPGEPAPLVCADDHWRPVSDPYPASDRWLSYSTPMTLHGGGRQNPELESGQWTATPLDTDGRCRAEQLSVTYGKVDGPPRIDQNDPGRQMSLEVVPRLLTIELSGNCLWQRVNR